ncbi:MAG TPA: ELWxxDGT repeat protein [Thermoanaerobaculia bacterium]
MRRLGLILISFLLAAGARAQPAFLVKDLNTTLTSSTAQYPLAAEFVKLGSDILFTVSDGMHGAELWITDGTEAGTRLLKDLCPGACSSQPQSLTVVGSRIYFGATDGVHGLELWSTDGTAAGTQMVADLVPGLLGSSPASLVEHGGSILFLATDAAHGTEIWRSDGSAAGTQLVADLRPGAESSGAVFWQALGSAFYFLADDGTHGKELWKTDGTGAGTILVKDILPGSGSAFQHVQAPRRGHQPSAVAGSRLFFAANDSVNNYELWATDGTEAGTAVVKNIAPGSSLPRSFCTFEGKVFFSAADSQETGRELWMSDGTEAGTQLVKNIRHPVYPSFDSNSNPFDLTVVGKRLFFVARDHLGTWLWKTDGTEAGTVAIKSGLTSSTPTLAAVGDKLLFWAGHSTFGSEPWITDGTADGTFLLADLNPGEPGSFISDFFFLDRWLATGGSLYFRAASNEWAFSQDVFTTDGTPAGTRRLKQIGYASNFQPLPQGVLPGPRPMADFKGSLIFQGGQDFFGQLWKTDGTAAGTSSLFPYGFSWIPRELTPAGDRVFFPGFFGYGYMLWSTDGTHASEVGDPSSEFTNHPPRWLTRVGDLVYFTTTVFSNFPQLAAANGSEIEYLLGPSAPAWLVPLGSQLLFRGDAELWKSDGTDAGTVRVKEIQPGDGYSQPSQLIAAGGVVLFSADDGAAGRELWKTDGTEAGTVLVKDIRSGAGSGIRFSYDGRDLPDELWAAAGSTVFFPADDGTGSGEELWKSDVTEAGTLPVKDIRPGSASSEIRWLTAVGSRVFFVADDGVHGRELWVSDGTEAGTRMVVDILPGPGSSLPQELAALGNTLLFSATDGVNGREPWRTAGSALGTRRIQDIAPGALSSSPMAFTASGPNVYFAANDGATGFELWAVRQPSLHSIFGDVAADYWAWRFVEALAWAGITTGCAPGLYCPLNQVSRAEMAVFLGRGIHGAAFTPPPATGTRFTDVPASYWAAAWIEQFAADGITTGCAPSQFCPDALVNRAEMAVFLLRSKHGAAYTPPPATGTRFTDVPASYWAAAWIEQLAAEGITTGCAPNQYCPGNSVSRDQMAAFLVRTFNLPVN